jgi:peptidoglycan hydrolase CwlO-like protein
MQLQRAMLWAFLATLIALIGVTTVAWIRRPKTAPPPAAVARRGSVPVLANDPDGSVYDLNLRIAELQARLNESETLVVSQQKRLDEAQHQRTQLEKKVQDLAGDIKTLRTAFEKTQEPPARPPATSSEEMPTDTPPGGAVPTPTPPSPAAPP